MLIKFLLNRFLITLIIKAKFMSSPMKDFLDQFFELCKKYQEEIKPEIMAEILRDYADRLEG